MSATGKNSVERIAMWAAIFDITLTTLIHGGHNMGI
jgi:hypothetical protein